MKALKVIGILILVIVGIGLIASLVLPKDMEISESTSINAPIDVVWNNVSSWEKIDKWSPWYKSDPDLKATFEGEPGTLSSKFSWVGNDDVGSGYQTFKNINKDSNRVESEVVFLKPWEGRGDVTVQLEMEGEGVTKATWSYKSHVGIPGNLFSALFNAKGMLSEMYALGLSKLKENAETEFKNTPKAPVYDILLQTREAATYVGKKEVIKIDSVGGYFEKSMGALMGAVQAAKLEMVGPASGIYWDWNMEKGEAEMTVAAPIKGTKAPAGYSVYSIPAGDFLMINYMGDSEKVGDAHMAMETYMNTNGYEMNGPALEEYVISFDTEQDPSKHHTRILYPVKKAAVPAP